MGDRVVLAWCVIVGTNGASPHAAASGPGETQFKGGMVHDRKSIVLNEDRQTNVQAPPSPDRSDTASFFDTERVKADLKIRSVRGGAVTMAGQGIMFVIQTASTMVLARLLTPADYGLIGMVMVVVNFAQMFKDAGLSMATVQKESISHEQISTLFWVNILISAVLGMCVLASSPVVAAFYGRPELSAITALLSISFIISGLSIQHVAILRRNMRFGNLAVVQISAELVRFIVTILLAVYGWRYWALVGGSLARASASTALTFFFCPWLPGRMRRRTGVRGMLKFGSHLTGFNFINYFSRNADNILIGRLVGADALGLYAKAYQIVYMPLLNIRNPINAVAIPLLSRLQDEPERFKRYYGRIVFLLAFFSMPVMAFCVVFAEQLILLVFGPKWLSMTGIFRVLAFAGFIQPVAGSKGALLVAMGRTRIYLLQGILMAVATVAGFSIGVVWGPVGVATSYTIVLYLIQYPLFRITFQHTYGSFRSVLGNCWHIASISWLGVLCAKCAVTFVPVFGDSPLLWGSLAATMVVLALFLVIPALRIQLMEDLLLLKKVFSPQR